MSDEAPREPRQPRSPGNVSNVWWIASYPKSGNTWMRAFLTAYITGANAEMTALVGTQDVSPPWNHFASPIPGKDATLWEQYAIRPVALLYLREQMVQEQRLWVKTHNCVGDVHGYYLIPPMLCDGAIYIVRDPRSVVASWAAHMGVELEKAAQQLMDDTRVLSKDGFYQYVGSWAINVDSWIHNADRLNAIVVRYEDLLHETEGAFREVVQHTFGEVDEERLQHAIEVTQFENLRATEEEQGFVEKSKHSEHFFRRGSDDWTEEVPPEIAEQLEDAFRETMAKCGYLEATEKAA